MASRSARATRLAFACAIGALVTGVVLAGLVGALSAPRCGLRCTTSPGAVLLPSQHLASRTPTPSIGALPAPAPTSSTSTTIDPGELPQTDQLPSQDAGFEQRMQLLWQAIVENDPPLAMPAFFPLSAYVQVKGISDPVHDYDTRLVPDFYEDISSLHAELGPGASSAVLVSVSVPTSQAQWVLPGVEYNKGSYWRVYGTEVSYRVGSAEGSFVVASMISWRGEWYVVHLLSIR